MKKNIHLFTENGEPAASVEHLMKLLKEKDAEILRLHRILRGKALKAGLTLSKPVAPTRH